VAFIHTFIEQLRTTDSDEAPWPLDAARQLVEHLEGRLASPYNDGFDLPVTGDDDRDRAALAAWLEASAQAPPFLAPTWSRRFASALAWLVRNNHPVSFENALVAGIAAMDPSMAELVRTKGFEAAYQQYISRRRMYT
jgi:hypothetical protein